MAVHPRAPVECRTTQEVSIRLQNPAKNVSELKKCPQCDYILLERTTYCPVCGTQLTQPMWKKAGAWVLLFLIVYALIKCHVRILDGFD